MTGKNDLEAAFCDAYVDTVEDVMTNLRPWWYEQDATKKVTIFLIYCKGLYNHVLCTVLTFSNKYGINLL